MEVHWTGIQGPNQTKRSEAFHFVANVFVSLFIDISKAFYVADLSPFTSNSLCSSG